MAYTQTNDQNHTKLPDYSTGFAVQIALNRMEIVSKLDAAKRHLIAAIKLFFEDGDPLVIHTIAAASQGVLRDIAKATKAEHLSILHDHPNIQMEHRKDWIKVLNIPRNFLKHADNDPNGMLEFDPIDNETVLLDAVLLHGTLAQEYLSSANVYIGWFTTKYPELRNAVAENQIGDYCVRNNIPPSDKAQFLELIDIKILIEPAQES